MADSCFLLFMSIHLWLESQSFLGIFTIKADSWGFSTICLVRLSQRYSLFAGLGSNPSLRLRRPEGYPSYPM